MAAEELNSIERPWWRYALALPIVFVCVFLGNLAGIVVTSVAEFGGMDYEKPGGVVLAAIQSGIGVFLAFWSCAKFLNDPEYARFWVMALVILGAGAGLLLLFLAISNGDFGYFASWKFASSLAGLVAMEVARRLAGEESWD